MIVTGSRGTAEGNHFYYTVYTMNILFNQNLGLVELYRNEYKNIWT